MSAESTNVTKRLNASQWGELRRLRKQFGEGDIGRKSFRIIAKGADCEAILEKRGEFDYIRCGKRAIGTVDVDASGVTDTIPSCDKHRRHIEDYITNEAAQRGSHIPYLGENGKGRP